jgi:hypothetical protein
LSSDIFLCITQVILNNYAIILLLMNTKTTMAISVIAATTLLLVIAPALIITAAYAVPAPKTDIDETTSCSDPRFADRESCPGRSEDAGGAGVEEREDEVTVTCEARNPGQAKDCPEGSTITTVNP